MLLSEGAAIGYATLGAATLQGLIFLERLRRWQAARQMARAAQQELPSLTAFIDAPADAAVACASTAFGALGGWLLASEISGVPLAIVAGAAAPEILAHLCRSTPLMNLLLEQTGAGEGGPRSATTPTAPEPFIAAGDEGAP